MRSNVDDNDQYADEYGVIKQIDLKYFDTIRKQIRDIHSPEFKNKRLSYIVAKITNRNGFLSKYNDWTILAKHKIKGYDFLATLDIHGFINGGRQEQFEENLNIKTRILNQEFVNEMSEMSKESQ